MDNNETKTIPIRSKLQMLDDIVKIIGFLHKGSRKSADPLINDLKAKAMFLEEQIQQDVLIFASQVYFQYDYDPFHNLTPEIQKSADKLIRDLGFQI